MSTSTPLKNPNSGLLEGFACPECGSFEPFEIIERILIEVFDEGWGRDTALGWDADSCCRCGECGREGIVADFKAQEGGA